MFWLLATIPLVCPDSLELRAAARQAGVVPVVMEAVAWMETRCNLDPRVRGPGRVIWDTLGNGKRVCREIGRMQLNPCTNRLDSLVRVNSDSNRVFGARKLRALYERCGKWTCAIRGYNGSGPKADEYLIKALIYIGKRSLE